MRRRLSTSSILSSGEPRGPANLATAAPWILPVMAERGFQVEESARELLVARRAVESEEQLLKIGQEGAKSAEALQLAKEVSRVDVLQARVEVEAAAIELQNAQNPAFDTTTQQEPRWTRHGECTTITRD
jgi:hypothetical protein